jgi:hypothetical protein
MKRVWVILAALALLLTAGCGEKRTASSAKGKSAASAEKSSAASSSKASSSSASSSASSAAPAAKTAITLETLLADIQETAPGSAGSSLKQMRAAGELLDWAQAGNTAEMAEVKAQLEKSEFSASTTAYAWAGVLDAADQILAGTAADTLSDAGYTLQNKTYDPALFHAAEKSLSPLFTRALEEAKTTPYAFERHGVYADITADKFEGIWCSSSDATMLVFSGNTCRVVAPYLDTYGETAAAMRVRDRSKLGYCPSLQIDLNGKGDYAGALTYYVSGVDGTHFWSNTQSERFDLLSQEG